MRLPSALATAALLGLITSGPTMAPAGAAAPAAQGQVLPGGGTLRGRVDVRRHASIERRPRAADLGAAPIHQDHAIRPAVVYLEDPAVPKDSNLYGTRVEPRRARMDQRNETFVPGVLAVGVGSVVDFPNSDTTYHNVFSLSKINRFDLGRYGRGKSEAVRFDKPGIVRVFCDIHSHMSAFVLVFNHPYFATTDDEGRYRIDGIPSGTYTVTAWHEGNARDTRTVTISGGGVVDLDLLVQ